MSAQNQPPQYASYASPHFSINKRLAMLGSDKSKKSLRTQPTATPPDMLPPVGVQDETPISPVPIDTGDSSTHILMPNEFNKVKTSNKEDDDDDDDDDNSVSEKSPSRKRPKRGMKAKPNPPASKNLQRLR